MFLAFILGGMVAGTVASSAAWLPAFYTFAVPTLAPIASRYILEGNEVSAVMGGFLVLYGAALAVLAHNLNRVLRRSAILQSALGESEKRFRKVRSEKDKRCPGVLRRVASPACDLPCVDPPSPRGHHHRRREAIRTHGPSICAPCTRRLVCRLAGHVGGSGRRPGGLHRGVRWR